MNEQLRLIDPPDPEWKLGAETRRIGRLGVRGAKRALDQARREHSRNAA
jgi:hypothetical protein